MTGCILIGDCIALGLGAFANVMIPGGFDVHARVGASIAEVARTAPARHVGIAIVSAGSNDATSAFISVELLSLRARLHADRIVWLYPRASSAAWAVYTVARAHGDRAISLAMLPSRDNIHPRDYRAAAAHIRADLIRSQPIVAVR